MSDETASPSPIKISWLLGILAGFAIFALIGGYSARMTQDYTGYDQDRATQRKATLAKLQESENKLLNPLDDNKKPTAEWIDQDKGIIRIPIDQAMTVVVADLKSKAPTAGCEINPAAPAAAAPAAGATNAAPAMPAAPAAKASTGAAPTTPPPAKPKT